MNYGRQESLREGPCGKGHAWSPIAPAPGRPGFTQHHCSVCGEWATLKSDGTPDPQSELEDRVIALEKRVAELEAIFARPALPPPKDR